MFKIAKFAAAASIVVAASSAALAADLPAKAPVYKAPVAVAYDWSGFYAGGEVGGQWSSIGLSDFNGGPAPLTYRPNHSSFALGAFIGYQKQFSQWVLGIEGGYVAGFGDKSLGATPSFSIFFPGGTGTGDAGFRGVWTIGPRVGIAMGQWMPYLTGGYANGRFKFSERTLPAGAPVDASANANGGYIGIGVDYALNHNWILGAEYRHYAFRNKTVAAAGGENITFDPKVDTLVARLSYKW